MALPNKVNMVEVGPRDGLQNEATPVSTEIKVEFIKRLAQSGLSTIEATSFVSPKWVPQMADHKEIMLALNTDNKVRYPALVPNLKGMETAIACGVKEISIFGAASETFSQKNINCSINESIARFEPVVKLAQENNITVRGYVSCVLGCPYEGDIDASKVAEVSTQLLDLGCYQISLGDTIGIGTPKSAIKMLETVANKISMDKLAIHFHNTYGQALANIYACLDLGVATIDSSSAGLGGCPYAKGASGNVASEDVLYMLNGLGIETGVELNALIQAGDYICRELGRDNRSNVAQALRS